MSFCGFYLFLFKWVFITELLIIIIISRIDIMRRRLNVIVTSERDILGNNQ